MTFLVLLLMAMGKKINLSDRLILKEALNQNTFSELIILIKKIFKYTLIFELIGAILLSIEFVPEYGISKGIFYSIFHSISAFCNAGIDIIGKNSFMDYSGNILINITLMILIIVGGLGFTVWSDIADAIRRKIKEKLSYKKVIRELTLHTKIVLVSTIVLLITGTLFIYLFEYNNLTTMANSSNGEKLLKSAFQATTLRTAGFSTINQEEMTTVSKLISICYMFVGGSPGSTAGGIKNVTMVVVLLLVISYMKDKEKINICKRNIPESVIKRAIVVFAISILVVIISTIGLLLTETFIKEEQLSSNLASFYTLSFMDILFEVVSAFGTVGLSLGVTPSITSLGKVILILLMIIGRLRSGDNINSFS